MNITTGRNTSNSDDLDEVYEDTHSRGTDTGSMMPTNSNHIRRRSGEGTIDTDIELENRFITPEATENFPEVTRDLRTSNLSDYDVDMAMRIGEILRYLDTIEKSYFEDKSFNKSRRMFVSDLQYIGNTRAGYKGFISQLMRTQRMENVPSTEMKETYEHGSNQDVFGAINKWRKGSGKSAKII